MNFSQDSEKTILPLTIASPREAYYKETEATWIVRRPLRTAFNTIDLHSLVIELNNLVVLSIITQSIKSL